MKRLLKRLFAERVFVMQSDGKERRIHLSSRLQKGFAGLSLLMVSGIVGYHYLPMLGAHKGEIAASDISHKISFVNVKGVDMALYNEDKKASSHSSEDKLISQTMHKIDFQLNKSLLQQEEVKSDMSETTLASLSPDNVSSQKLEVENEQQAEAIDLFATLAGNAIKDYKNTIKSVGFDPKDIEKVVGKTIARGGPISTDAGNIVLISQRARARVANLNNLGPQVATLSKAVKCMPLTEPVVDGHYVITGGFGERRIRVKHGRHVRGYHKGLDMAGKYRSPVFSGGQGRVVFSGRQRGYGNVIYIDHGCGFTTVYGHLSRRLVKKGQRVKAGQKIALMGSTGHSTGSHLHYEVRLGRKFLNPLKFIRAAQKRARKSS